MRIRKMSWLIIVVLTILLSPFAFANSQITAEKFQSIFCKLDPAKQSHPIIPADVYNDAAGKKFKCGEVTYGVRVHPDKDDPGHNVYNVDPPAGAKNVLDCDAKADVGMLNVALNCMPVTEETTEHIKP